MIVVIGILLVLLIISLGTFVLLRLLGESKEELLKDFPNYECKPNLKKWANLTIKVIYYIYIKLPLKVAYMIPTFEFLWKAKEDNCKETK